MLCWFLYYSSTHCSRKGELKTDEPFPFPKEGGAKEELTEHTWAKGKTIESQNQHWDKERVAEGEGNVSGHLFCKSLLIVEVRKRRGAAKERNRLSLTVTDAWGRTDPGSRLFRSNLERKDRTLIGCHRGSPSLNWILKMSPYTHTHTELYFPELS